jgi:hypothetical protein
MGWGHITGFILKNQAGTEGAVLARNPPVFKVSLESKGKIPSTEN